MKNKEETKVHDDYDVLCGQCGNSSLIEIEGVEMAMWCSHCNTDIFPEYRTKKEDE